ncbi:MAG: hypothetical protein D6814_17630 [Calditrichaeota bacterium]|nr:MAG: hypothetical protein D6814_17630 [Calditrichota bacterium]
MIEIAARLGGTCLPELTSLYSGMDVIELAIDLAMGKPVSLARPFREQPCAAKLIRAPQTGILKQAQFPVELLEDPRIVGIRWDRKPGDWVQAFKTGPDRIGEIVVIGETHREAEKLCDEIERQLDIRIEAS